LCHLICISQNVDQLGNQERCHNKANAIVHHSESSFDQANKKIRFICTLIPNSQKQYKQMTAGPPNEFILGFLVRSLQPKKNPLDQVKRNSKFS